MGLRGTGRPLDYEDIVRAITTTVGPLISPITERLKRVEEKVDHLSVDHVRLADHEMLRKEVAEGFAAIADQYVNKAVAEERYQGLTRRLDDLEKERREAMTLDASNRITQRNYGINWIFTAISLGIGLLSFLVLASSHLQFHP